MSSLSPLFPSVSCRSLDLRSNEFANARRDILRQFSPPTLISLDDFVFNTEAHPFRVPKSSHSPSTTDTAPPPIWSLSPAEEAREAKEPIGRGTPNQLAARIHQASALGPPFWTKQIRLEKAEREEEREKESKSKLELEMEEESDGLTMMEEEQEEKLRNAIEAAKGRTPIVEAGFA